MSKEIPRKFRIIKEVGREYFFSPKTYGLTVGDTVTEAFEDNFGGLVKGEIDTLIMIKEVDKPAYIDNQCLEEIKFAKQKLMGE